MGAAAQVVPTLKFPLAVKAEAELEENSFERRSGGSKSPSTILHW